MRKKGISFQIGYRPEEPEPTPLIIHLEQAVIARDLEKFKQKLAALQAELRKIGIGAQPQQASSPQEGSDRTKRSFGTRLLVQSEPRWVAGTFRRVSLGPSNT